MRILIAPDKFKGSLTATQAAQAMADGARQAFGSAVRIDLCPLADGGEGTVQTLVDATGGVMHQTEVLGPLLERVQATWGMLGDGATAVIEMAEAAGLHLVPIEKRKPAETTTAGVGTLLIEACNEGAKQIILGIGGSGTNDCGAGMADELGYMFLGRCGGPIPFPNGRCLSLVRKIAGELRADVAAVSIRVACDVTNPLFGPNGAAHVYGPQKGATPKMIRQLDRGARNIARFFPQVDPNAPGMGAAGGLGFGLVAFCHATLARGIDLVMDAVGFEQRVAEADLILTGEGRFDSQSLQGKVCAGVAKAAAKTGVPVVVFAGQVAAKRQAWRAAGIQEAFALCGDGNEQTVRDTMRNGAERLGSVVAEKLGEMDLTGDRE